MASVSIADCVPSWLGDPDVHAVGVLPAFGRSTGMHPIDHRSGDRVFAVAGEDIREVPVQPAGSRPATS
jgi:hypothetical protein